MATTKKSTTTKKKPTATKIAPKLNETKKDTQVINKNENIENCPQKSPQNAQLGDKLDIMRRKTLELIDQQYKKYSSKVVIANTELTDIFMALVGGVNRIKDELEGE